MQPRPRRRRAPHAVRLINWAVSRRLVLVLAGAALCAAAAAQPAGASVVWRADGERTLSNEWAELSTALHCAVTSDQTGGDSRAYRTTAVKAKGTGAYAFAVNDGDNCWGERAEIGQALPSRGAMTDARLFREGQNRWVSFQVRLGGDFPKDASAWDVIAQWKQLAYPNMTEPYPMLTLQVHDGHYWLDYRGSDLWRGPNAVLNRWARFTFHFHWSDDPNTGGMSIRGNPDGAGYRLLMPWRRLQTLAKTSNGTSVPAHARIGIYRNASIRGTAHLWYDGYTVATSRERAEASAF